MPVLETKNLTKKYRRITALDQLNLTVEPGMVFGMLGPNGSGKTTTLGLLLDVLKASSGSYLWFGEEPSADSRKKIGAILESPCFYPFMTATQNLKVVARIKECAPSQIERVLKLVGLWERRDDPFKTYSLGMKQRLAIGSALLSDPAVLILDEPTNGLDPMGIFDIRQLIRDIAAMGKTIMVASHLLDEVQKVCTHFMVLQKGKKLFQGSVDEALGDQRTIEVASEDQELLGKHLSELTGVSKLTFEDGVYKLTPETHLNTGDVNKFLFQRNIVADHLVEKGGDLEQQFLKILADQGS